MSDYATGGLIPPSADREAIPIYFTAGEKIIRANGEVYEFQPPSWWQVYQWPETVGHWVRVNTDKEAAARVAGIRTSLDMLNQPTEAS